MLEKNHVRNSRRKQSLAKKKKTEMFGQEFELKKSLEDIITCEDALEELAKGDIRNAAKGLAVTLGMAGMLGGLGSTGKGKSYAEMEAQRKGGISQQRPASVKPTNDWHSLQTQEGTDKHDYLNRVGESHGRSHGIDPNTARGYIKSHPGLNDMYGSFAADSDEDLNYMIQNHKSMGRDLASHHYDTLMGQKGPSEERWGGMNKQESWFASKFTSRT